MSETLGDLFLLLRLRVRLLLRWTLSRYTRSARLAAPVRFGITVLFFLIILVSLIPILSRVFGSAVSGPLGRLYLTPSLAWGLSVTTVLIFFYAVISLASRLTYASDLKLLLLTPISPKLLVAEKMLSVALGFAPLLLLAMPGLLGIGQDLHLGPWYDITALSMVLLVPIAPVSLAMLLVLAILRWIPHARVRAVAAILGTIVGGAIYIAVSIVSSSPRGATSGASPPPSIPDLVPSTWPGHALAAVGLGQQDTALGYLLATILFAGVLAAVAIVLSAHVFTTGWATYQEVGRQRAAVSSQPVGAAPRSGVLHTPSRGGPPTQSIDTLGHAVARPSWWALFHKEWLSLRRDPQRAATLAFPLVIIGFFAYRVFSVQSATDSISGFDFNSFVLASFYAMLTAACVLEVGSFAPAIVNGEGRSLYLLALTPLSSRDILLSKWAICATPVLVLVEALLIAGAVFLHIALSHAILASLAMAALALALPGIVICINLVWPRLNADNPRQQVSLVAGLVGLLSEIILGGAVWLLLLLTFTWWSDKPVAAAATALGIFLLTGSVAGLAILSGPRLLEKLLTSR